MKITNKLGLPQPLVDAVSMREPSDSYSASMLMQSPRMVWLKRRHFGEVEKDVSEQIWALFGTAVHGIIEKYETADSIQEAYLSHELDGVKVTGMADVYENGKISDWKTSSVWSLIFLDDEKLLAYESQLNCYAWLYRKAGFDVTGLEIVMLFRDWQASKAKYDASYPQSQVHKLTIKLWSEEQAEKHILDRVHLFEKFRDTPDDDLPFCSDADRWAKPSKWALMKEGRKSAVKLYDEKPEMELEPKHYWEERKAEQFKRCEYCDAVNFCNQYKEGQE